MMDVLVADDDRNVLESVSRALIDAGHRVTEAADGAEAAELVAAHVFDLAICDVQMPRMGGLTLLRRIRREAPGTAVVLMTAYGQIPDVVESMRDGAVDYVTKPFDPDDLVARIVTPIEERRALKKKFDEARANAVARAAGAALVARSPAMRKLVGRMGALANSDAPAVVVGARGTGKELVARTLHAQGGRRDGPYTLMDGAVLGELLTSVERRKDGSSEAWLRDVLGGTLVLDALEATPFAAQAQLARMLGSPAFVARHGTDGKPHGARLVTLTRARLPDMVAAGRLLDSLHACLAGVELEMPPLVDRAADLVPLVAELLRELVPPNKTGPGVTPEAWRTLTHYRYPGNVRELRWILEHALAMSEGGPIEREHLPSEALAG
jgi:DNA-binding NtrC family response regulator